MFHVQTSITFYYNMNSNITSNNRHDELYIPKEIPYKPLTERDKVLSRQYRLQDHIRYRFLQSSTRPYRHL